MNIIYFANPVSVHDSKWINFFANQHEVAVLCQASVELCNSQLDPGIKVYPILPPFSFFHLRTSDVLHKARHLIESHRPDVAHSMYAMPNAIWADLLMQDRHLLTTRGSDVLVDYAVTYSNPRGLKQRISYRFVRKSFEKAIRRAFAVTSTSYRQRTAVTEIRGSDDGLHLVRTGVEETAFQPVPLAENDNSPVIFCPRSMKPVYNLELLIRGFRMFRRKNETIDPILRIIDDRPDTEYSEVIRELVKKGQTDGRVEVLPKLKQEEMRDQYAAADLVVMIPSSDGTPVSAIEAMMTKRPVMVGDLEYDNDLFNEETVFKAEGFEDGDIAHALDQGLTSKDREKKIENAYAAVLENASLSKSLERIHKLYEDIRDSSS